MPSARAVSRGGAGGGIKSRLAVPQCLLPCRPSIPGLGKGGGKIHILAWLVYRYLGLKFLSRGWFNLDAIWASSVILVSTLALALNAAD